MTRQAHQSTRCLLAAMACLTLLAGCSEGQHDESSIPASTLDARIDVESAFEAIVQLHPPTTGASLGVSGPMRESPTPAQWALENTFRPGIDVGWRDNGATQDQPIRIAILDESFDLEAPGLSHAFDQEAGINLLNPGSPLWTAHRDGFHHGNLVASIIANRPVGAVAPLGLLANHEVRLIPIVAAGGSGPAWRTPRATPELILAGLRHALEARADIINISAGVEMQARELATLSQDPIWNRLADAGIPVVCAAGNQGHNLDESPVFPASIDHPNVMAVMAIGPAGMPAIRSLPDGTWSAGTNWGPETVDFAAPGEVIEVQARADRPELVDGTSAAAAFVTAILAIQETGGVKPLPGLADRCRTGGIIRLGSTQD